MKTLLMSTTAALAIAAGAGHAQSIADQVISQLQSQGYQRIEVTNGRTQVKVEAVRDGRKLEVIYDAATGAILKEEVERVDDDDDTTPGIEIDTKNRDFLDDDDEDDEDDDEDDEDDERDDEEDDEEDDEHDDEDDDEDDDDEDDDEDDEDDDDEDDDEDDEDDE